MCLVGNVVCAVASGCQVPYSVAADMPWPFVWYLRAMRTETKRPRSVCGIAQPRQEPVRGGHDRGEQWREVRKVGGRQERREYKAHRFPLEWQFYCDLSHRWRFTSRYLAQLDILLCALRERHESARNTRMACVVI